MEQRLFVGLAAEGEAPAAITGLKGLIGDDFLHGSIGERGGAHAVVEAGWEFEADAEGDVAAVLSWRAQYPGLRAEDDVTEAGDVEGAVGRVFLVRVPWRTGTKALTDQRGESCRSALML